MKTNDRQTRVFYFNAHAHGLSAQIRRPFQHDVEVQAGTSLPITGGHGNSRADNFRFKEIISFKAAYSQVAGSRNEDDGSYTTLASATVEGLNVLDVVTADRVVARLSSHYAPGEKEAKLVAVGSKFENLRIAGCKVEIDFDEHLLCHLDTYAAFRDKHDKDSEFRKSLAQRYNWTDRESKSVAEGFALCSLAKEVRTECPCVERRGHVLRVPQFGKIHFAELLLRPHERSLTMIRLELGSPCAGSAAVAGVTTDGSPYPPTH